MLQSDVVRAYGGAEPAHHVRHPGRAEPHLGVGEANVDLAEHVLVGHDDAIEPDLAVAADHGPVEGADVPPHLEPRRRARHQEHGGSSGVTGVAGRPGHHDQEAGAFGAGDEPLVTVELPPPGYPRRARSQRARVGAGAGRRLGHRERRPHVAGDQRTEEALSLRLGRDVGEQVDVALIGRGDVERERSEQGVPSGLEDWSPVDHAEAESAVRRRCVRAEQPAVPGRRLEPAPQVVAAGGRDVPARGVLDWEDLLAHEARGAVRQVEDVRGVLEVDRHAGTVADRPSTKFSAYSESSSAFILSM